MNFWPRERFPFIPTVAAAIPFQPIQSPFNNPAWDISQPVLANAYYASGINSNSPWSQTTVNQSESQNSEMHEKSKSPASRSGHSHGDASPRRYDRERSRERERDRDKDRRRRRSRDRRSPDRDRDERSRDRRESSRRSRDEERDDRKRDRSPYDRRDEENGRRRDRSPFEGRFDDRSRSDKDGSDDSPPRRSRNAEGDKLSLEAANYKTQTPNETIRIRGLAQHITENDIRQDIHQCGLIPKDIRLIRKKETGVSRGFAFVEFNNTEEALAWMEQKQGVLMLQDMYRAVMEFSIATADASASAGWQPSADWDCLRCYAHNFKKRVTCYKCLAPRPDSADATAGGNEISPHPTTKLMIRNLDPLTDEEALLKEVNAVSDIPIQSCRISRDSPTNLSRGVCYLEMKNVLEAIKLYNALTAGPLVIEGKKVAISYCKLQPDKPEPASYPGAQPMQQSYTLADVPQLAEYSARMYASNPTQKAAYLQYYTQYYTNQINQMAKADSITDVNSAAAVAQSAIQMAQTKKAVLAGAAASALSAAAALNGQASARPATSYTYMTTQQLIGNTAIGEPDSSTWSYDETSGYYFDPKTGLHFDPTTNYYYHSQEQMFLYWDTTKRAYMAANAEGSKDGKQDDGKDDKKKDKDKSQDKVKVAKRIAKDMERWAKTLNQKKDVTRQTQAAIEQAQIAARSAATADIAFAVLERKEAGQLDLPSPTEDPGALVASYGGGSDSDEGAEDPTANDSHHHTDWSKLACLLCKRQFPSKEGLQRHQQLSDLHKQNLEAWYRSRGLEVPSQKPASSLGGYRDRAKERRQKFGIPDTPKPNKLKEKYMKDQDPPTYEEPNIQGIPSGNLGSKMLQKMGWSEGMGLGKMNQGRTDIVQAVQRVSSAGLGVAGSNIGPAGPGASYKDNVKRAAMARFSEMMN